MNHKSNFILGRREVLRSILFMAGSAVGNCWVSAAGMVKVGSHEDDLFAGPVDCLSALRSDVIFQGDATTAYRDPAAVYCNGWFYLYFTLAKIEPDEQVYLYTAWAKSRDLLSWTDVRLITPRDRRLNFCSPGDVVRYRKNWVMCLQTYPRPNGEKYGNEDCRIWTMRSHDLEHWEKPALLRVKGKSVPIGAMGRMIDPYLLQDKDIPNKWWCFYKQNGISISWSLDLKVWNFRGSIDAGENPAIIVDRNEYVLFHSPDNGIGVKRSADLITWRDEGVLTLGQNGWPWAKGRLTAGFVLDLRRVPEVGKALMFFHGSAYPEDDPRGGFDNFCSIGIAWSNNLKDWEWPTSRDSKKMNGQNTSGDGLVKSGPRPALS